MVDFSDTSWAQLREPHERLRWARLRLYPTATAFADAVGLKKDTYTAHEREPGSSKATRLTAEKAMQFGRKLKVRWEWLLEGKGLPWPDDSSAGRSRPAAQVAELVDSADPEEQERILRVVQAMRTGTSG